MSTRVIKIILSIFVILIGLGMSIISWLAFDYDFTDIEYLASLYVSQFISVIVMVVGMISIVFNKGEYHSYSPKNEHNKEKEVKENVK